MVDHVIVEERDIAFQNRLQSFSITNIDHIDTNTFFDDAFVHFESRIKTILDTHYLIKVGTCFLVKFEKTVVDEDGEK